MKIGIVGAGGVGGLLAGFLLADGNEVYLSARGEHAKAIERSGLKVEVQGKRFHKTPTAVLTNDLSQFSNCDVIILTVKMYDLESVCMSLKPYVKSTTTFVTLQNGVEAVATVKKHFPEGEVAGGIIITSARIESPGLIVHEGANNKVTIENRNAITTKLNEALARSGINCELAEDIQSVLWKKLIRLASVSGVTCLTRQPFGWIARNPEAKQFLFSLIGEAFLLGKSLGINLPEDTIEVSYQGLVSHCNDNFKPSMLLDLERGKRLEVRYLSGAVSRLGKEKNIPTPCSDAVVVALGPYENGSIQAV